MNPSPVKTFDLTMPYPANPLARRLLKSPILLYRLGLGGVIGRLFMILTTTGRKSGQPRRTAIEYHEFEGRKYLVNAWGERSDWYRNLLADPRVTLQTQHGVESALARRITDEAELAQAYRFVLSNPTMRAFLRLMTGGSELMSLEDFLAQRQRIYLITFDPTSQPTPSGVEVDLRWVWGLAAGSFILGWLAGRRGRRGG